MTVYFVGAGPGDPELLTRRGEALLRRCRVCVYAGSLINPALLELCPAGAELSDSAPLTLEQILALLQNAEDRGEDSVRLHSGDPSIYGAIGEQIRALEARNIRCEVVPGVSSFQAVAARLGLELTAPEVSQTVILTRLGGRTPVPEEQSLEQLAKTRATLCLFLSVHRIAEIANILSEHYGRDCPVAVVYHASWPDELQLRGTLGDIAQKVQGAGLARTSMIIVGHALSSSLPASKLYDRDFFHQYRGPS